MSSSTQPKTKTKFVNNNTNKYDNIGAEKKEEEIIAERFTQFKNPFDDRAKNGIKTYTWGNAYWTMWHLMAESMKNFAPNFVPFIHFLMISPQDLLPCVYCRKSYAKLIKMPDYDIATFMLAKCLPQYVYVCHNAVNNKLDKPLHSGLASSALSADSCAAAAVARSSSGDDGEAMDGQCQCRNVAIYTIEELLGIPSMPSATDTYKKSFANRKSSILCNELNECKCHDESGNGGSSSDRHGDIKEKDRWKLPYERIFWMWLQTIVFNYPADIQLIDYWSGKSENKFTFEDGSAKQEELQQRLKTYVLFFDLLKHFIDRESPLQVKWIQAYVTNPPTPFTYSSRTNLLEWLLQMQKDCGGIDPLDIVADVGLVQTSNQSSVNNISNYSIVEFLNQLHPIRAI